MPDAERVKIYMKWWEDKEKMRDARRAEAEGAYNAYRNRKIDGRLPEKDDFSDEEDLELDGPEPALALERERELNDILGLDTTAERLRVLCPVPDDLLSIWRTSFPYSLRQACCDDDDDDDGCPGREEWWSDAVGRLPALEWTMDQVNHLASEDDLFGSKWPIAREVPARTVTDQNKK